MNKIYIIRRMNIGNGGPSYLLLEFVTNVTWVHDVSECTIFGLVEDAFVVVNQLKDTLNALDYCVMEIEVNEKRVDISTTPSE